MFILKNKKKLMIFSPFFVIFFISFSLYNFLGPTVGTILTLVLKPKIFIEKIELPPKISKNGKITAKNVILTYKKQEIVVAPELDVFYNLNNPMKSWIEKIVINSPKVLIERKNSDINIIEAFSSSTVGESKAGTEVPLKTILVNDGEIIFRDNSYKFPIEKKLNSAKGYVTFDQIKGIDLKFQGRENETELSYSFNNEVEEYSMNISGKNIPLNTEILQYAYYYEDIDYKKGVGDLDLTISPKGLYGYADIKNLNVNYKPFLEKAENVTAKVEFRGEVIDIQADFELFGKNRYFSLNFDFNEELNIDIDLGDLSYQQVAKYYLLKDLNLDFDKINFVNSDIKLNLNKEKKFSARLNLNIENVEEENYSYKDGKIEISVQEEAIEIKLLKSELNILDFTENISSTLILKDNKLNILYSIGDFQGQGEVEFSDENLNLNFYEGFVQTKGIYDYKSKKLTLKNIEEVLKENKFLIQYSFKENNLISYEGKVKLNILDKYFAVLDGLGKENLLTIKNFLITDNKDKLILKSSGDLNLNTLLYNFKFKVEELSLNKEINSNKIKTVSSFTGELKNGEKGNVLDLDGTLEKLDINDFKLRGIKISFRLKENLLEILDLSNNFLTFKGDYNIIENSLKGNFKIDEFKNDTLDINFLEFNLVSAQGEIFGTLDNPEIKSSISRAEVYFPNKQVIDFRGEINLKEKEFFFNDFIINDKNKINGKYSFKENNYEIFGNVSEKNIFKYLDMKDLKANLNGDFVAKGSSESLEINSNLEMENIYLKGNKIPEIKMKLDYIGDLKFKGILNFKKVELIREDYKIGELFGNIDLNKKTLDIKLMENTFRIGKAFPEYKIKGPIELDFHLKGELESPKYEFSIKSEGVNYEEIQFDNLNLKGNGDKNNVNLEVLSFQYQNNKFQATGKYGVLEKDYNFQFNSQDIQLDFLNVFLEKYSNSSLKGRAYFDLKLSNKGNTGVVAGEDIGFNFPKQGILGEQIDFEFELLEKKLEIVNFQGFINQGKTELLGFLNLPTLREIDTNPYYYEDLNYELTLKTEKLKYEVPNYMDFLINIDLNLNSNKIRGEVEVEKGNLVKIPGIGEGFNLFKIIKEFIFDKTLGKKPKTEELWNDELETTYESKIELDVDMRIKEGIKIDVESIGGIVQNLNGNFKGGGKLSGKGKKINFLGEFNLNNGEFVLTGNDFQINSARIIFNNSKDVFPEINPIINFEAGSKSFTDNISLSLNGELNALQFAIKSNGNVSSGNLSSLFTNTSGDSSNKNAISSLLLKGAIDSQITQTFLGPVSREIKKFFGLSKLRISSDFTSAIMQEDNLNDSLQKEQEYSFGAKIEIADALYKDKLFWVATAKITSNTSNRSSDIASTEEKRTGASFNEYSGGFLYKFSQSNSLEIGAQSFGKDSVGIKNKETDKKSLNYYIDFKIQKKYDSLSEIFKNIINKVKK